MIQNLVVIDEGWPVRASILHGIVGGSARRVEECPSKLLASRATTLLLPILHALRAWSPVIAR